MTPGQGIYLYHRLERAAPNALPGGRKPPKEPPEIFEIPSLTEIVATDILDADRKFEELTGVNPVKYKGATPPITVTVPTLRNLRRSA
jgi:hypothetical protein